MADNHLLRLLPCDGVVQSIRRHSEVIPSFRLEGNFLQCSDALVALWRLEFQIRPPVRLHVHHELRRKFVRASVTVLELEFVGLTVLERKILERGYGLL